MLLLLGISFEKGVHVHVRVQSLIRIEEHNTEKLVSTKQLVTGIGNFIERLSEFKRMSYCDVGWRQSEMGKSCYHRVGFE